MFNEGYSLSDVAAVTGGGNGFGNGYGMWIWVILILAIFGWGNGGWGGYGTQSGIGENYALTSDMAQIERKIDGVYSGICDSTFALNNTITNGFAAAQNTMTQGFAGLNTGLVTQGYETRNAITQDTIANMQGFNNLQGAVKDCCCQTQQNIKDVSYNVATQANGIVNAVNQGFCQTNFNAQTNARDIIDTQNAGTQAILARIDALESSRKDEKIAELQAMNSDLRLRASQEAQNTYLVNQLRPCPVPAYITCNPFAASYGNNCSGCNC